MEKYLWWAKPKTKEEIPPYLDNLFQYAGENLWTKILKPRVREELELEISHPSGDPESSEQK